MPTILIKPRRNFHNSKPLRMRPQSAGHNLNGERAYFFNSHQAAKIDRHFCGLSDCTCNSGGLRQENEGGTLWSIAESDCVTQQWEKVPSVTYGGKPYF